mgnify:CR=1 FL=1
MKTEAKESTNKTWFIDIDGTIVKHNSNDQIDEAIKTKGHDSHLIEVPITPSIKFLNSIPYDDTIILTPLTYANKNNEINITRTINIIE